MAYIVIIEDNGNPATMSEWTINQSFEAEFDSLMDADMYVRSLERWSYADSHDSNWIKNAPMFRIYCEDAGEFL
jgi:hypothetical protein